ncbi:MAG: hypothetical protein JW803_04120 [Endomicrobiales bacterium]|nr:hypothetical protein [Endomicrobiales bacterium]
MPKNLVITGKPSSGKTTLVREATLPYAAACGGFFTEEIRENGKREGFLLKTFEGKSGVLARKGMKSSLKLDKYGIDTGVLEGIGAQTLREAVRISKLIVVDEIGTMEIMSDKFRAALMDCLNSPKPVLATIRFKAQPFTDEIKKLADTEMVFLSRENYAQVKEKIRNWLKTRLDADTGGGRQEY